MSSYSAKTIKQLEGLEAVRCLPGMYVGNNGEYQFDWLQMRWWGIPESRIPAETVILNRPNNFFERDAWVLPSLGVVTALLVLTVIALLWYLRMRRRIERILEISEEKFRVLYNNSPDMYVSVSPDDAKILLCNETLLKKTGYLREEIVGFPILKIYHEDCIDEAKEAFEQFVETGVVQDKELTLKRKDGGKIEVSLNVNAVRDETGKIVQSMSSWRDITERIQAEEALKANEKRFRALFEQAGDYCMILDPNTADGIPIILDANKAACEMHGYTREEFIGRPVAVVDDEKGKKLVVKHTQQIMTGKPFFVENTHLRKDGTTFHVSVHANRIDIEGEPPLIFTTEYDITERKQTEEALQKSEDRYRNLVENMNDLVYRYEFVPQRGFVYVSPSATKITGYTPEEHYADPDLGMKLVHPKDRELLENLTFGEEKTQKPIILKWVKKDGRVIWTEQRTSLVYDEAGNLVAIEGVARDITERKRAEKLLLKNQIRLEYALRGTKTGAWELDLQRRDVWRSLEHDQIFGYKELLPRWTRDMFLDHVVPEDREEVNRKFQHALATNSEWNFECRITRVDGGERWIFAKGKQEFFEDEGSEKMFGIVQDITERKEMEIQLLQNQKMESIGRLAGGIAHDFNNILVPIIGYVEMAMMNLPADDKLYLDLKRVREAADRATDLVHQILAFSRKQVLEMQVLDLNTIARNFKAMIQRLIGEDIELQIFLKPTLHRVNADAGQIEQVLMNLAVNARDAMPTGGKLTIETANVYLDKDYINRYVGAQLPGDYVMLAVSDTGCGMDDETRQQIFEPFFTTKARGKGTGLGLSTVFGIIKQHGGNIWVYSEPDKGTTFKIYLPKVDSTVQTSQATPTASAPTYGTETILVVEDEEMVRQLVCETLTVHGYEVLEAQSPNNALQLASERKGSIDLLLTDVIMPEMNGRYLYQKVAAIAPDIKVLYMSGYTDNIIDHHGILKKGDNFLQKPFTIQSLTQKVRQVLSRGEL